MHDSRKPTRLDLRHLRYALAVADAQGFRAAAELLNIAQPAISKAVKDTEVDLGFRIFDRSGPRVLPTPEGVVFLDDARQTVAQFERTIRASRQNAAGARGHIIVGYSALAASRQISETLDAFHHSIPGVQVEMHVMSTDNMLKNLKSGVIDLGFLLSHPTVGAPGIDQMPVWSSSIGIVTPAGEAPARVKDLDGVPFVMGLRENWRSWRALLDSACDHANLSTVVVDEAWDVQVILQRVAERRGVTFFPMSMADSLPAALELALIDGLDAEATISMAWSTKADTSLLRQFRNHFPQLA
ncbi:LysR family transcriptional regulator [Tritonibacter scottomollicae]|uniref:LysR family transcriptional regulator n=1 Tax=Tritonibacter scottomollicae TaxID=483013 RepID=A0A2T1A595_TRISK|nr:LysR family transcriptional regulator [Tritonibacter scottomollicae]PRZ43771.1 LysR family transcriptional regulator [Tritonibacter scottomollicae]